MAFVNRESLLQDLARGLEAVKESAIVNVKLWYVTPKFELCVYNVPEAILNILDGLSGIYFDGPRECVRTKSGKLIGRADYYDLSEATAVVIERC